MIAIDFQGGMHGNYLEFVCNRYIACIPCNDSPFNDNGASHCKIYEVIPVFYSGHFFQRGGIPHQFNKVISVRMSEEDLLSISAISLLRAGDYGYDNQQLEINTYNKLNNRSYRWVLDNLLSSFFNDQIKQSYDAIKDKSWPSVTTVDDFKQLPARIKKECLEQHGLALRELTTDNPHCPRQILREFFKIGFKFPHGSGFWTQQKKMIYSTAQSVHEFPFSAFYSFDRFIEELEKISRFSGYDFRLDDRLETLHSQFLDKQPYRFYKQQTDDIFDRIIFRVPTDLSQLDLLQEAYLDSRLEQHFQKETLTEQKVWFANEKEVWKHFCNYN